MKVRWTHKDKDLQLVLKESLITRARINITANIEVLPEKDRATPVGKCHKRVKKIGEDRTCGSGDMLADRHAYQYHNTKGFMLELVQVGDSNQHA